MTQTTSPRDHRVDFWRGIALVMIFINHVPGTPWENLTSRNFGFSDAAELFVFLAGFACAFAYGRSFLAGDVFGATLRCLKRAGTLYLVHIFLTIAAAALFAAAAILSGMDGIARLHGAGALYNQPREALIGLPLLSFQIGYVNILPLYVLLIASAPILLLLARYGTGLMLGVSAVLWFCAGHFDVSLPAWPNGGSWFFDPFSWQFLFAIGLACGLRRHHQGAAVPFSAPLWGSCLGFLLLAFLVTEYHAWNALKTDILPFPVASFAKDHLGGWRLLHVLALAYVFANAPLRSPLSRIAASNPLAMLGRHSLPVFACGTLLSLLGQTIIRTSAADPYRDTAYLALGLLVQFALASWLEYCRNRRRRPARTEQHAEPPYLIAAE